jgi:hypothetical protein
MDQRSARPAAVANWSPLSTRPTRTWPRGGAVPAPAAGTAAAQAAGAPARPGRPGGAGRRRGTRPTPALPGRAVGWAGSVFDSISGPHTRSEDEGWNLQTEAAICSLFGIAPTDPHGFFKFTYQCRRLTRNGLRLLASVPGAGADCEKKLVWLRETI